MVELCSKVTGVSFCALALMWAVAFAPTIGGSGFAIMMFNSFQKNRGKKKAFLFNNDADYTLLICFLEKKLFSQRKPMHMILVSIIAYIHVQDPNVKVLHLWLSLIVEAILTIELWRYTCLYH